MLAASVYNNITVSKIWQNFTVRAFNQVVVPVKDFQNDQVVVMHPVQCTSCHPWQGGAPRRDDIFIKKDRLYRVLNRYLLAYLEVIFAIKNLILNIVH